MRSKRGVTTFKLDWTSAPEENMKYRIRHTLRYRYSKPVFVEPMTLRICPRVDSHQRLLDFEQRIFPDPLGLNACSDLEGNPIQNIWFSELTDQLMISATSTVEIDRGNPFAFLLREDSTVLPVVLNDLESQMTLAHRTPQFVSHRAQDLAREVLNETKRQALPFLTRLCAVIQERCLSVVRLFGPPLNPDETLRRGTGACRDVSMVFIEACRWVNLPARFVTGYFWDENQTEQQNLHAWAEVYLPGGGWVGFDPSTGLAVTDRHVAVTSSSHPSLTSPTSGTYRGNEVKGELQAQVIIRPLQTESVSRAS